MPSLVSTYSNTDMALLPERRLRGRCRLCDNKKSTKYLDAPSLIKVFDANRLEVTVIADRPSLLTWLASHDPLTVVPLEDPVVEAAGHDPRSAYVETYWTACLGPTSTLLLRRLAGWLEDSPDGFPLPLAPLARELGLGEATGRNSAVVRSLARIVEFNMAQIRGDTLAVRRALPPLARRHEHRIPSHLIARHRAELEAPALVVGSVLPGQNVVVGARFGEVAGARRATGRGRSPDGPTPSPSPSDGWSAA